MDKNAGKQSKALRLGELIAIALGGMVGGGIFSILGVSVQYIGNTTPVAILIGGILALFAAYSYVKLALLYKDEGATYSFFKLTFPKSKLASSIIGWLIVFGYISTLALYSFTFSSYFCSQFEALSAPIWHKIISGLVITLFAVINLVSVKGMGRVEDFMVYTKVIILLFISGLLAGKGNIHNLMPVVESGTRIPTILLVAAITFVAYEGFQLVIHAYKEMEQPQKNIPKAIYTSIAIATVLYIVLAIAAMSVIPKEHIIADKEFALAAGAREFLGAFGQIVVIFGALLATSSAISGTIFGSSRLMAVIAHDGYFPKFFENRIKGHIPNYAIIFISAGAYVLVLSGGLKLILEFGSITFITVSFLMAIANYVKRKDTRSNTFVTILAMVGLCMAGFMIAYFEFTENKLEFFVINLMFLVLAVGAFLYSRKGKRI